MKISIKLSTLYWLFVWPILPFTLFFGPPPQRWSIGWCDFLGLLSFFLTIAYVGSAIAVPLDYCNPTDLAVIAAEDQGDSKYGQKLKITVESGNPMQLLPWSYTTTKQYLRCQIAPDTKVLWIDVERAEKLAAEHAEGLEALYATSVQASENEVREVTEAELVRSILAE